MTVQVIELQRAGGKFYFIVPAEFEPMAMLHEELADEALRTNMICMCHDKAKADMIAAALNATVRDTRTMDEWAKFQHKVDISTYVQSVSYHNERCVLEVIFRSNPGTIYSYEAISPDEWTRIQTAPSVGSYISRVIVGPTGNNRPPVPPFKYTKRAVANG